MTSGDSGGVMAGRRKGNADAMRRYNATLNALKGLEDVIIACESDEERDLRYGTFMAMLRRLGGYSVQAGWPPSDTWEGYDDADFADAA